MPVFSNEVLHFLLMTSGRVSKLVGCFLCFYTNLLRITFALLWRLIYFMGSGWGWLAMIRRFSAVNAAHVTQLEGHHDDACVNWHPEKFIPFEPTWLSFMRYRVYIPVGALVDIMNKAVSCPQSLFLNALSVHSGSWWYICVVLTKLWTTRGSIAKKGKEFFFSLKRPNQLWRPPSILFNWYGEGGGVGGSFAGVKWPGRQVHNISAFYVEVRNKWDYTFTSLCLHSVHRSTYTFIFLALRSRRPPSLPLYRRLASFAAQRSLTYRRIRFVTHCEPFHTNHERIQTCGNVTKFKGCKT
jgi:hypothetical protein